MLIGFEVSFFALDKGIEENKGTEKSKTHKWKSAKQNLVKGVLLWQGKNFELYEMQEV